MAVTLRDLLRHHSSLLHGWIPVTVQVLPVGLDAIAAQVAALGQEVTIRFTSEGIPAILADVQALAALQRAREVGLEIETDDAEVGSEDQTRAPDEETAGST